MAARPSARKPKLKLLALLLLATLCLPACTPRVVVRPNPGPDARGIRYYRPKPYLLITPLKVERSKVDRDAETPFLDESYVTIELQYLPDFSEEYVINIRTGLGTNDTQITLTDGWNLTGLHAKMDSQTDENINAVANLLKGVASLPSVARMQGDEPGDGAVCRASNVPLGYYESVIGRDPQGRKQLYGWRYVGFMPFNGCPTVAGGQTVQCCNEFETYGLVFEEGVMKFVPLGVLRQSTEDGLYEFKAKQKPQAAGAEDLPPPDKQNDLVPVQPSGVDEDADPYGAADAR